MTYPSLPKVRILPPSTKYKNLTIFSCVYSSAFSFVIIKYLALHLVEQEAEILSTVKTAFFFF